MKTKPSIAVLKCYLKDLLTMDPILREKGIKEEIARVERVIENMKEEKEKKEEKKNIFECFEKLLNFIDNNPVTDESADDGGGYTDEWRSTEFNGLINKAREELGKLAQLSYHLSTEIVPRFGGNNHIENNKSLAAYIAYKLLENNNNSLLDNEEDLPSSF